MTPKYLVGLGVVVAIGVALWLAVSYTQKEGTPAPIVDPTCEPGYVLVGEGCITLREECELRGDEYVYAESAKACIRKDGAANPASGQQ